jgi:hypothetical protein
MLHFPRGGARGGRYSRGMKTPIAFILIVLGAGVLLTPIMLSFLLTMTGKPDSISADDRFACQVAGPVMILAGVIMGLAAKSGQSGGPR